MEKKLNLQIGELAMDSLIISKKSGEILYNHSFYFRINARSIAKTITSLVCGILIDDSNEDFNEDTLVFNLLKNKVNITNANNLHYLNQLRVKDCLTHTVGYRDVILMSKDIEDFDKEKLIEYTLNYPIYTKPGNAFLYSNAGHYILSAAMEEYLGYSLFDYVKSNLFDKIGITDIRWDHYGKYLAGPTKIYLNASDLLKIGLILANNGYYYDKKIVSSAWINKMTSLKYKNYKDYKTKNYLSDDFYGYGIWTGKDNIKYASGLGGQYVIFDEKSGTIIVTTNDGNLNKSHLIKNQIDSIIDLIRKEKYGRL